MRTSSELKVGRRGMPAGRATLLALLSAGIAMAVVYTDAVRRWHQRGAGHPAMG